MTDRVGRFGRALLLIVVALGLLLSGCSSNRASMASRVRSWASGASYGSDNSVLQSDLSHMATGRKERDLVGLHTVCEAFSADADTLYAELPTPDETLTNEFNTALVNFGKAAESCYAASSFHSKQYRVYLSELDAGRAAYTRAIKLLARFDVH